MPYLHTGAVVALGVPDRDLAQLRGGAHGRLVPSEVGTT